MATGPSLSPTTVTLAHKIARILAARHAPRHEREDFGAEIVAEVAIRWSGYDPTRGTPGAYVEVIARGKAAKLIRERRAQKRGAGQSTAPLDEGAAVTTPSPFQPWEIAADVRAVLASLSPEMRAICEDVMRAETVSMAARQRDLARSTLVTRLDELRPLFERTNLRDYLVK